jgi:hypothetical protein
MGGESVDLPQNAQSGSRRRGDQFAAITEKNILVELEPAQVAVGGG